MSDDVAIILLSPVDEPALPGVLQITADCGHECWIGEVSLNATLNPFMKTKTQCNRCVDKRALRKAISKEGGLSALPGAKEELAAAVGQEEADRTWREMHVKEREL